MNAKVFLTGKSFGETCGYAIERQDMAQVLYAEGLRLHKAELMAKDFEMQHQYWMPGKLKPVFHSALSFPPGERVDDARLVEIGQKYMEKIGMADTQYVLVKHVDKAHLHVHVIANRVGNDGEPTGKGLVIERSMKAAKELTEEYGLRQHRGKRLDQTRLEALHEPDAKRYRIYQAIREVVPRCRGLDELEKELLKQGITVRYRRNGETGERQGISFRVENRSFKGSQVDNEYSLWKLEKKLALNMRQEVERQVRQREDMAERLKQSMKGPGSLDGDGLEPLRKERDLKRASKKEEREEELRRRQVLQPRAEAGGEKKQEQKLEQVPKLEQVQERKQEQTPKQELDDDVELKQGQGLRRGLRPHF